MNRVEELLAIFTKVEALHAIVPEAFKLHVLGIATDLTLMAADMLNEEYKACEYENG